LPAKTVPELIALAGANPGKLNYASQGIGSTAHLTMELFKSRTGSELNHVPYRGAAPAVNDLAGGHVDTMFCDLGTILPLHQGGKLRIIASAARNPVPQLPNVPTVEQSAVKDFNSTTFYALTAPPRTSAAIRDKLNKAIVAAMQTADAQAKLKSIHVQSSSLDVDAVGAFIRSEARLWGGVIRDAKITVE
jgi:tripartite-type tricarboxylate transporter receptor subunit TctC